jgi:iron complex outermembrane receptor protein
LFVASRKIVNAPASATWLDAHYRDAFAGARIPGIARSALFAALGWRPPQGWRAGVELRALSRVMVNDANSDAAAGYALFGAHAGYLWRAGRWELNGFVRGDNLADRRVIGSVIVNEANNRYFEPAPGRTWLVGANAQLSF